MTLDAVLSWNDESSIESQFRIYRSQSPSPTWKTDFSELDTVSADTESYTDTDIPKVESLTYAVVAVSLAGESDPSISDTLDTTDQTLTISTADGGVTSVTITRTRLVVVSTSDAETISVELSRFPIISKHTLSKSDQTGPEYNQRSSEFSYPNQENEVIYHNG